MKNHNVLRHLELPDCYMKSKTDNLDDQYRSIREKIENNEKAIGILTRNRTNQPLLEQALRLYHLPYTLSSGRGFFNNQEVTDCLNLLSFLLDAHDDLSFVGILRSPFVGFSDAGLLALRNEIDHHNGQYILGCGPANVEKYK